MHRDRSPPGTVERWAALSLHVHNIIIVWSILLFIVTESVLSNAAYWHDIPLAIPIYLYFATSHLQALCWWPSSLLSSCSSSPRSLLLIDFLLLPFILPFSFFLPLCLLHRPSPPLSIHFSAADDLHRVLTRIIGEKESVFLVGVEYSSMVARFYTQIYEQ